MASTSQDGPVLVGGNDDSEQNTRPLLIDHVTGALLVKTQGGGVGSDVNLIEVGGSPIALGETTMANSLPVVIASDQTPIPITGSISATNPSVDTVGGAVPADATLIGFQDSGGNLEPVVLESDGSIPVTVVAGGGTNASVSATGAAVPASATYIGVNVGGNLTGAITGHGTAAGALRVELPTDGTGQVTVPGVSTAANQAAVTGSKTGGTAATSSILSGGVYRAAPLALADGEQAAVSIDDEGVLLINVSNSQVPVVGLGTPGSPAGGVLTVQGDPAMTPLLVDGTGGSFPVSGTVAVTQSTSPWVVGQSTASNLKAQVVGAGTAGSADANPITVQGIASMTPVQVSQATASNLNATVVGTGTFAAQVTAVGTVADDGTTPGSPVMVGGFMKNFDGTSPGNVSTEDDVVRLITDPNRRLYVNDVHPQFWSYHLDTSSAQTDTQIQGAPGGNLAVFITDIIFSTGAATACNIFFEEGSTKILGPYYLEAVAGRGVVISFRTPKQVTANTAVTFTTSASIAQCIDVCGFIARVN